MDSYWSVYYYCDGRIEESAIQTVNTCWGGDTGLGCTHLAWSPCLYGAYGTQDINSPECRQYDSLLTTFTLSSCSDGETQACSTGSECSGTQVCSSGAWGACQKTDACCGSTDPCCSGSGDPCDCPLNANNHSALNVWSGNLSHSQDLFSIRAAGLTTSVSFYYNSLSSDAGSLGKKWTYTYDVRLDEMSNGSMQLREGNGQRRTYDKSGSNFVSRPGDHAILAKNDDGSFILIEHNGIARYFDQNGKISSVVDRNGNTMNFTYDSGNLTRVIDSAGRVTQFSYGANNKVASITDPAGGVYTLAYSGSTLASVMDPEGGVWTYTYDSDAFMLTKTDPNGNVTMYMYDSSHREISATTSEGKTKTMTYTPGASVMTEADGGNWTYAYDTALGVLVQKTDPQGGATSYTYDQNRNMSSQTDPDGSTTSYAYDAGGNMTAKTDALGRTTSYTYNVFGQVVSITDTDGNNTSNTYDDNGNLVEATDATGATRKYKYDPKGNVTAVTDPARQTTTYTYDVQNNLAAVIDATGASTRFTYDAAGNIASQTDPNGNTTMFTYDSLNHLLSVTNAGNNTTTYSYDKSGNRTTQTDANGNTTTFEYNSQGQIIKAKDALGNATTYNYGGAGCASCSGGTDKLTSITDAAGNTMRFEYDQQGRKIKDIDALGNAVQYTYDAKGDLLTRTDGNGHVTSYTYDPLSRIKEQTDALMGVTKFEYSSQGRIAKVTDTLGNATVYEYDPAGRVVKTISADIGTTTYTYNAAGTLATKTDANGTTINYDYDSLNRLTSIRFPDARQNITYGYDSCINGKGRRCSMTDASGATAYEYDKLGLVIKETKTVLAVPYTIIYAYDKVGNVTSMTYPSGRKVAFSYNGNNRVTSVSEQLNRSTVNIASSFMYNKLGMPVSIRLGNSLTQTWTYDPDNRIATITAPGTMNAAYVYDPAGNITSIADQLDPTKSRTYTYDSLDRLATGTGPWGSLAWTYDANGNRLSQTNGAQYKYSYNANRLETVSNGHIDRYQYDNNGNTTSDGQKDFVYNQNQRLIRATENGKPLAEYIYNGNGQRVIKKTGPASTNSASSQNIVYHYDLNGKLIAETDGNGKMIAEYVYLNGQPLAMMTKQANNERIYYYHNDHLATPQRMTDGTGAVVWSADYKPFGEATITVSTIKNNFRFPGQYYDAETRTLYNYFRDYNSSIGRYIEADRIGLFGGINLYRYVRLNPIRFKDHFGLWDDAGHTDLTQKVLQRFENTFNAVDIATVVSANLNVDRLANQFNDAAHYMPGTKDAADALINKLLQSAIQLQKAGNHKVAMRFLGQCLHTAQDRFSHFEQNAGWTEHLPGGTDPDSPTKHPSEYARARNSTEGIVSIFLIEINR